MKNFIKITLSILFIGCLFDMPYGYFQLIRFLGMVGFGILAFNQYKMNQFWFIIWLASAILINPIFKISLGRDIIWALILVASVFINQNKTETS